MKKEGRLVLAVDDDLLALDALRLILEATDFQIDIASDGVEALEKITNHFYPVIVTDLEMPRMNGFDLVQRVLGLPQKPVILISSAFSDVNTVVKMMREGVYDYILKPYHSDELIVRLEKAFEVSELRLLKQRVEEERDLRIKAQLDWNLWKEKIVKGNTDGTDQKLIGSIRTSLSQGAGFGALVSIIKRIEKKSVKEENYFKVEESLVHALFENGRAAKRVIDLFEEMELIVSNDIVSNYISIGEIYECLEEVRSEVQDLLSLKGQTLLLGKNHFVTQNLFIKGNLESLKKTFLEIIYNAIKFSIPDSKIYITLGKSSDHIQLGFLSPPEKDQQGNYGIIEEYESLVFEPFFRISKLVYEKIPTLDFGLGLTYVDKVVRKHGGLVRPYLVRNYLDALGSRHFVHFEVELPLAQMS
ncbi:hybrid sensor histidine kinase/response regulator [Leptospira idonii]|uniref:hybrid sensor histidine kinase/response regulator n=1 Tax=Leptospira idonii TaxID=1193500 RepID=UPI0014384E6D|nr:response regulator [Leptospira idonii]